VNVPGRRINEADVQDALDALQQWGLVEELPGGLFRLNTDAAARLVAAAAQEELRAYRSRAAVEQPPVFR
jgi:hypothetical protein